MSVLSGATPKTVGDPSEVYLSLKPLWDRNHAVCGGERYVKERDRILDTLFYNNFLIPFSPNMTQEQYNFYRAEAELPGITSQFAKMLVGSLLRKQPTIELPKSVPESAKDWIMEEFGTDGAPITSFLKDALWEEMQTDNTWIYVGYPAVNTKDLTKQEKEKYRPSPTIWTAEVAATGRTHPSAGAGGRAMKRGSVPRCGCAE